MKMTEFVSLKIGDELLERRPSRSDMIRVLLEEAIEAREAKKDGVPA